MTRRVEHLGVFSCGERMIVEAKARRNVWQEVRAQAEGELKFLNHLIESYERNKGG